jgi:hypothetical protein
LENRHPGYADESGVLALTWVRRTFAAKQQNEGAGWACQLTVLEGQVGDCWKP